MSVLRIVEKSKKFCIKTSKFNCNRKRRCSHVLMRYFSVELSIICEDLHQCLVARMQYGGFVIERDDIGKVKVLLKAAKGAFPARFFNDLFAKIKYVAIR